MKYVGDGCMPNEFLEHMNELLDQDDYQKLLFSYQEKPKKSIRLQLDKVDSKKWEQISPFRVQKIPFLEAGYYVDEEKIGNHPYHHAGLFYVQEPSAMLPPLLIPCSSDFKILDLCASPGGKTLALSNQVPNGFVLSNEVNYKRAKKLLSNVERLGLKNVVVSSMTSRNLNNIYHSYFDLILIDAPCSGEGMFRKDERAKKEWSIKKIEECRLIGAELLEHAASMLQENGYLIYSTCTFSITENESQIVEFLKKHNFDIVDISWIDPISKNGILIDSNYRTDRARRCYPFLYGEGQFMIVLQKKETTKVEKIENYIVELSPLEKMMVDQFIKTSLNNFDYCIKKYQNHVIVLPKREVEVPKMTLLSCFVKMGQIEKNRFIPHHQFVKAYGSYFKNQCHLLLEDERVIQYLKGLEIEASVENGYGVLMVNRYPLGLYKAKNNKLKNHYPKGLRYQG